jgi:hypothetical protein
MNEVHSGLRLDLDLETLLIRSDKTDAILAILDLLVPHESLPEKFQPVKILQRAQIPPDSLP